MRCIKGHKDAKGGQGGQRGHKGGIKGQKGAYRGTKGHKGNAHRRNITCEGVIKGHKGA